MIVTFYSYKGGVGRSMALANVAEILASRGYRVTACDWDLEAPGLERYFSADRQQAEGLKKHPGIIDLLREYKKALSDDEPPETGTDTPQHFTDVNGIRLRKPSSYAVSVPESGVRLLPAGRRDGEHQARYNSDVQAFGWNEFYREWAGASYLEFLRKDLDSDRSAIVLVDSRTGVTEQGGVCTHHLADLVVILSAPNDLNLDGAKWMVGVLQNKSLEQLRGRRRLGILPLASRVEVINEEGHLSGFEKRFADEFSQFPPKELGDPRVFLRRAQIPYIPAFSFEERVVAREDPHKRNLLLFDAYTRIADAIIRWGVDAELLSAPSTEGEQAPPLAQITNPFVGLQAYGENDAAVFQGRDNFIAQLIEKLRDSGVVVLAGDKGVGKTSLVRAGLIPAVRQGALNRDGESFQWPVTYLNKATLDDVRAHLTSPGLLVIDNLEEIVPASEADSQFAAWVDLLHALPWSNPPADRRLVLIVRQGELPRIAQHPRLASFVQGHVMVLPPLDVQRWIGAVESRAQTAGLRIEDGLLSTLLADFGGSQNIPLLELQLLRLWDQRDRNRLTLDEYNRLGGFKRIVTEHAEASWHALAPDDQKLAKKILLRLVVPGEGSEDMPRAAAEAELHSIDKARSVDHVLRRLAEHWLVRQLLVNGGKFVEIGHPILLREWPRMRVWIDESRESLRALRRLQASVQAWVEAGRPSDRLLTAGRLAEARALAAQKTYELQAIESEFINASRRADLRATFLGAAMTAILLGGIIVWQYNKAPDPYLNAVNESFLVPASGDAPNADLWDAPTNWRIVPGEGSEPTDGALLVDGNALGALKPVSMFDFDASFKVRVLKGAKAVWAFRVQPDRRRYYAFELTRDASGQVLAGVNVVSGNDVAPLGAPMKGAPDGCCLPNDAFRVNARIEGSTFRFGIAVDPNSVVSDDIAPYYGQTLRVETTDPSGAYAYGSVGFLADTNGQVRVEYLEISNLGPKK